MFPELRSRTNALEHCGSLGKCYFPWAKYLYLLIAKIYSCRYTLSSGGHVVVPKTEKENLDVVAIAEQYYKVWNKKVQIDANFQKQICEAKQNSGKTIWIGINSEVNMNEWQISGEKREKWQLKKMTHFVCVKKLKRWQQGGNMTGKRVGYTNWKDASPNGNCAYLFTKVSWQSWSDFSFSSQTGVGNKGKWGDAICSINSVLNLCTICQFDEAVVEYFILGMCQVGFNQNANSDNISGKHLGPWVHPWVWAGETGWRCATFLEGSDEHKHQVQHHEQDVGDETPAQPKLCSARRPKGKRRKRLPNWKVESFFCVPAFDFALQVQVAGVQSWVQHYQQGDIIDTEQVKEKQEPLKKRLSGVSEVCDRQHRSSHATMGIASL